MTRLIRLFIFVLGIMFFSCSQDQMDEIIPSSENKEYSISELEAKAEFSEALSAVLSESKEFRVLLKKEALRKINYDYDVLYTLIKNESCGNETVESLFSKYIDLTRLRKIESLYPTLTIFIPELPEDSFSAELWDVKDLPAVSYVIPGEGIQVIYSDGNKMMMEDNVIPNYPIVVVKKNERIIEAGDFRTPSSIILANKKSTNGLPLLFLDKEFDNYSKTEKSEIAPEKQAEDIKKIFTAYDVFKLDGWQRDYIYYNLTASVEKGKFDASYMEHIVGFEMVGDGLTAYRKISDQTGDPTIEEGISPGRGRVITGWTDGEFEFLVKYYVGTKNPVGSMHSTFFRAKGKDLFNVTYQPAGSKGLMIKSVENKRINLSLPLFEWNLEYFSPLIKISIEEVDAVQSSTQLTSTTSEFAGNIGYDLNWGETVKKGLKFGASAKETHTSSYQITTTWGNDELGEVLINFADPIIINKEDIAPPVTPGRNPGSNVNIPVAPPTPIPNYNKKYQTGWYRLYITPKKIY